MQKLNVLIIDDTQEDFELCSRILEKIFDCTLTHIQYAAEALEMLDTNKFHLILLDYNLPDMNGIEFLKEVKLRGYNLAGPIIILTGQGNEEIAVNFLKLGASDYIIKGNISMQTLSRSIQNALTNFQSSHLAYEKQQELYRFAQTITHDLKGPLGRIHSYCDLIKENVNKDSEPNLKLLKYSDNIQEDSSHCIAFLNSLFSYAERGRSEAEMSSINLGNIIERSIRNLELQVTESKADIVIKDLPEVYGDGMALTQLFQNLISNSIKHSDQVPKIEISAESNNDYINILVADNGVGIPTEMVQEVFKPFVRLSKGDKRSGIGLGLALCKTIIDQHNGSIDILPNEKGGSIFRIKIPNTLQNVN